MQKGRNLFRITKSRRLILSEIITTLRIESDNKAGLGLTFIEMLPDTDSRKEAKLKAKLCEIKKAQKYTDVFRTVLYHGSDYDAKDNRERLRYEDRGWENEWDIPFEFFNESLLYAKEIFEINSKLTGCTFVEVFRLLEELSVFINAAKDQ